jgi:hypothetical protein
MRANALVGVVAAAIALGSILPAAAGATAVSASLTGLNGDGSFNDRLDCGAENGAGDTWRYAWQDQLASDASGVLAGRWNGDFEVHRAARGAFVPAGDGHLALTVASPGGRSGTAFFDTAGGGACDDAALTLTPLELSDPTAQQVSGSLPVVATGGLGALRGLTGSGTVALTLELTPGADNAATISLAGSLDVPDPAIAVASGSARWANLTAFLQHRLTVTVNLVNGATAGDAFDVKVASVSPGSFDGLPTAPATIPAGGTSAHSFVLRNASPGHSYNLAVTVAAKDGLLGAQPPVTGTVQVKAPLLP